MSNYLKSIPNALSILFAFLLIPGISYSQIPENTPQPTGPVDLSSTSDVVIFIVIPVVILIIYLIFRKRIGKVRKEKSERIIKDK